MQTFRVRHDEMIADLAGVVWKKIPKRMRRFFVVLTQDRFTVSVAAILTNRSGQALLLDHRIRPKGGWGLPGGFIDHGEDPADGLRREILEETGLEIRELQLVRCRTVGAHIEVLFAAAADGEPELRSSEIRDFGWFDRSELPPAMNREEKRVIEAVLGEAFEKRWSSY